MTVWDRAIVDAWLENRLSYARADQVEAERRGRDGQDDCDAAAAEEMVCTLLRGKSDQDVLVNTLTALLVRDEYIWCGVYNDQRFDRHVRTYVRKLLKMAKTSQGFDKLTRYQ